MKRYPISVSPRADEEVLELAAYIAQRNRSNEMALAFINAFEEASWQIAEAPTRWALSRHRAKGDETLRQCRIRGFPNYMVFYRFDEQKVSIIRVLHGARDLPIQLRRDVE